MSYEISLIHNITDSEYSLFENKHKTEPLKFHGPLFKLENPYQKVLVLAWHPHRQRFHQTRSQRQK